MIRSVSLHLPGDIGRLAFAAGAGERGASRGPIGGREAWMGLEGMAGFDEGMAALLRTLEPVRRPAGGTVEQRLAGLTLERKLAAFTLEQRLGGVRREGWLAELTPEQILLAMPDEMLHGLLDDILARVEAPRERDSTAQRG